MKLIFDNFNFSQFVASVSATRIQNRAAARERRRSVPGPRLHVGVSRGSQDPHVSALSSSYDF